MAASLYGSDNRGTWDWKQQLVFALRGQGRRAESGQLQEEVLAWMRQAYGEDDPGVSNCLGQLGYDYFLQGRYEESLRVLDEVLERGLPVKSIDSSPKQFWMATRARALYGLGRKDEARRQVDEASAFVQQEFGARCAEMAELEYYLALWDCDACAYEEARVHIAKAVGILSACNQEWNLRNRLAWMLATSDAAEVRDGPQAVAIATKACEETDFELATTLDTLAAAYAEIGEFDSAIKWGEQAVKFAPDAVKRERYTRHLEVFRSGKPWR